MREIKFRGKQLGNGEWVYGCLIKMDSQGSQSFIYPFYEGASSMSCGQLVALTMQAIDLETVGQYTGLKDKNGREIYEGDVVRTHFSFDHATTQEPFVITWNDKKAMFEGVKPKDHTEKDGYLTRFSFFPEQRFIYEVIGNIYENPELLEVAK